VKRILRILLWVVIGLATLVLALLIVASIVYSPALVSRMLRWGDADVYDYEKFPSRAIETSSESFSFEVALEENRVRQLFESEAQIRNLDEFLESSGTQAFLIIQEDKILYEAYFNEAQRDSIVTSFSMAKSFVSALIGIAIHDGYIEDVNDPITDYIPELLETDELFSEIRIRDLLLMSSGIRYREGVPYMDDARTYYDPDLRALALEQTEILNPPGESFLYNNYHPLILGLILERSTGVPVAQYLQEKIWKPLGMEYPATWSLDSEQSGFEKMESGINARAIDFAKFGRLFLKLGNWEGTQVIPETWVIDSLSEDPTRTSSSYYSSDYGQIIRSTAEGGYYKNFWYGYQRDAERNDFLAEGDKGQFIYVSPEKELIIIRNGERFGMESADWIEAFYRFASDL
jgi:CubicO group peptidase (beta-lactamase class C family)